MGGCALLFPGQGAQKVGMGRELANTFPASRAIFEQADELLGLPLSQLCFEGPEERLRSTDNAQTAIFVTSVATVLGLEEAGLLDRRSIQASAGLSLGEYTALWFGGVFSFEAGLSLVALRGRAMQEASERVPSGMLSLLGADRARGQELCERARGEGVLVVANLNAPGQVVLSGDLAACARAREMAREMGIKRALPLKVAGAFHSPLMEPARQQLEQALEATPFEEARKPVYVNVSGEPLTGGAKLRRALAAQVVEPVLWEKSIRHMLQDGFQRFLEPEPGRVLAGLLRKIDPEVQVEALSPAWKGNAPA